MAKGSTRGAKIPDHLIYEMDEGKPIYYRDYRKVLNNTKTAEEIMGSGILQSLLVELIKDHLKPQFGKSYVLLANELGIRFSKKSWRSADIAVFQKKELLKTELPNKYSEIPPELVIEIDTKASLDHFEHPEEYYHRKTDQLLDFGIHQVLWVFTATKKFMFAEKGRRWETGNWNEDLIIRPGISLNIQQLLDEFEKQE